jgi:hypothetical protein
MLTRTGARGGWFLATLAVIGIAATVVGGPPAATAETSREPMLGDRPEIATDELVGAASKYIAINPVRVLDSRTDPDIETLIDNQSITIDPVTSTGVAAAAGVDPNDIVAVAVNITIARATGRGWASMWPTGSNRELTSTNNFDFAGQNIANLAIIPLGLENKISLYADRGTDVILDIVGVFETATSSTDGRFVDMEPVRHSDTRSSGDRFARGETRTIDLTTAGLPADAAAALLNVTATRTGLRAFARVWSDGDPPPPHSNVNWPDVNFNAANQVITRVKNGKIKVYAEQDTDLIIDIGGYFTAGGAANSADGLFVPFSPARFLDSRQPGGPTGLTGGAKLAPGQVYTVPVPGVGDVPASGVKAVAFNLTANQTDGRGFVVGFEAGAPTPGPSDPSSLNFVNVNQTVPNHAITRVSSTGLSLITDQATHLVVDASGFFLDGTTAPPTGSGPSKIVDPTDIVPPAPGVPTGDGPYDFLWDRRAKQVTGFRDGSRNPWNRCQPLRYQVNIDMADQGEVDVLLDSIDATELATGVDFQYAGVTSAGLNIQVDSYAPSGVDAIIGYSDTSQTPQLAGSVIGVGGNARAGQSGFAFLGFVVIDLDALANGDEIEATATHELGHMMSLGHVSDFDPRTGVGSSDWQGVNPGPWTTSQLQDQLMYPALNPFRDSDTFDDGDLRGLHDLYGSQTCPTLAALDADTPAPPAPVRDDAEWTVVYDS